MIGIFFKTQTPDIVRTFRSFYVDLYTSKVQPSDLEIGGFFDDCVLPRLSASDAGLLNPPTDRGRTDIAAGTIPSLPSKVYKRYAGTLLPILLKVYNEALWTGVLPASMNEAIIVAILKPGRDANLADSYRPILLLTTDVKLLA